jgi:hypothetical protein
MVRYVQLDKRLIKQMKRLLKAGGNSRLAAEHAENIIRQWLSGEVKSPRQLTRGTRYGEARIKNCLKYDLVHAYRLLAVKDGDQLFFLFVGPHDECDQWINHNTGWEPGVEERGNKTLYVVADGMTIMAEEAEADADDADDECLLKAIDEKDLRIIFAGICRSGAEQDSAQTDRNELE